MITPCPKFCTLTSLPISYLLQTTRTIAVVGLSPKFERDSNEVARYLQAAGYRVVPVNPVVAASSQPIILGQRCYASLQDAAKEYAIDMVDVFRQSDAVPAVVDDAMAIGAKSLWLQLGVVHDAAVVKARAAGLVVVQDLCIKLEHRAWLCAGNVGAERIPFQLDK
jgi:uncharacterized protein